MIGNRVEVGFFSMSGRSASGDDTAYLRWHLLDHMPEQFRLPGVVHAQRWLVDDDCLASERIAEAGLADVRNVVLYLMGRPVRATLDDFAALGAELGRAGRFGERLPSRLLGPHTLVDTFASPRALVDPAVVPFRPHQGVCVIVEEPRADGDVDEWLRWLRCEHHPDLGGVEGVAGGWVFRVRPGDDVTPWPAADRIVTVVYLDGAPVPTSDRLQRLLERRWQGAVRPLLVTPMRSLLAWEPFLAEQP